MVIGGRTDEASVRVGRGIGVPLRTEALPNSEYPNSQDVNEKAASSNG